MGRVIFQKDAERTIKLLEDANYKFTTSNAIGMNDEPVKMIFCTTRRKALKNF